MAMPPDYDVMKEFLQSVSSFVNNELIPSERRVEETDSVPDEIVESMRKLGLFGMSIPEEYGGLGLSVSQEVSVVELINYSSPAFGSRIAINNGIGSLGILFDGTEDQKRQWLPKIAAGNILCSFALTEPNAGSDAASISTTAKRVDGGYLLNGTKRFITNAPDADLFTIIARAKKSESGPGGISAFLVDASNSGLSLGATDKKMGQRGSHTSDVILDNCFVPLASLVGEREGRGFQMAMKVLDRGRIHMAAACLGVADRLIKEAVEYSLHRKQFGKPIGEFQLIQAMLADSYTEAYAARSMVFDAAKRKDDGQGIAVQASCCKLFASEMVGRIADRALQIHGGAGYMSGTVVERLYRDVRLLRIYEGTSQIQQVQIAKSLLRDAAIGNG